jgi:hypothetical protein
MLEEANELLNSNLRVALKEFDLESAHEKRMLERTNFGPVATGSER